MRKQITHMIKHGYLPFSRCKKVYGKKAAAGTASIPGMQQWISSGPTSVDDCRMLDINTRKHS